MKNLKIGIIGMSEGNGHPYSWSAIFNGYDQNFMKDCPFPGIPEYLSKQHFPEDAIHGARVTHIWTQDRKISEHIAASSNIENIAENPEDLIGKVDAVLLARDDAEKHYEMALPFLKTGLPVFVDKPLAYNLKTAKEIFDLARNENQLMSCTALRFAKEFSLSPCDIERMGEIILVEAMVPKDWKHYGVHIIEPVVHLIPKNRGRISKVANSGSGEVDIVTVTWENGLKGVFYTLGHAVTPIKIHFIGTKGNQELIFKDTFNAFKGSLQFFIDFVNGKNNGIDFNETLEIVEIIEKGERL